MGLRKWTIEVGGIERKYTKISYEKKLDMNSPTKFKAVIENTLDIKFMDTVVFKRNGIALWKGYVEDKDVEWDKNGNFLNLSGRDAAFIIWKKYLEDFSNYAQKTAGFFGQVSATELILFLMRCPHSDPCNVWDSVNGWTLQYPNNKEGWGLDASKLQCSAARTVMSSPSSGAGDPQYCKLRERGFGYRNSGNQWASSIMDAIGVSIPDTTWSTNGVSPWVNNVDYEHNNIKSNISYSGPDSGAVVSFDSPPENLPSVTPTGNITFTYGSNEIDGSGTNFLSFTEGDQISDGYYWYVIEEIDSDTLMYISSPYPYSTVTVAFDGNVSAQLSQINSLGIELWYKTDGSWDFWATAHYSVWIWVETQGMWEYLFDQTDGDVGVGGKGWTIREVDISKYIKTYEDLANVKIRVENESGANLSVYIGYMRLFLSYVSSGTQNGPNSILGSQDYFDISFPNQDIMGVYFESRMDNDSYPRNYEIVSQIGIKEIIGPATPRNPKAWTEYPSNTPRLVKNGGGSSPDVAFLFHAYSGEVTKNYQDWGASGLAEYDFVNSFTLNSSPTPSKDLHLATIFCASDTEGSRSQLDTNISAHFVALDIDSTYAFAGFVVHICIDSHYPSTTDSVPTVLQFDTQYFYEVKHVDGTVFIKIWSNAGTLYNKSFSYAYALRYLYDAQTWGATETYSESPIYTPLFPSTSPPEYGIDTDLTEAVANLGDWTQDQDYDGIHNPWTVYAFSNTTDKWIGIQAGPAELGSKAYSFRFNNLWSSGGILYTGGSITGGSITLKGRLYNGGSGHWDNVSIRVYVSIDGVNWKHNSGVDNVTFSSTDWTEQTLDLTDALMQIANPLPLVNLAGYWNVMVRLEFLGYSAGGDENHGGVEVCWMYWNSISGSGSWDNTGLNGDIQETSSQQAEIQLVPEVTNDGSKGGPYIDCVHSWNPVNIGNIRIRITKDDPDHGWAVSQVYVYGATEIRLRPYLGGVIYDDGSGRATVPPETAPVSPDPISGHYTGGPYIKNVIFEDSFSSPIGPVNIGRSRVLDALNFVVQQCYDQYYNVFEWWIDPDDNNTLHIKSLKGSDKSQTVFFEKANEPSGSDSHAKATNIKREKYVDDTVQRVYVVGEGEQKTQQEASVWVENEDAMDEIGTFYEEIDHEKSLAPDERGNPSVAQIIGEVYIKKNSTKRDQTVFKVSKDPYNTFDYTNPDDTSTYDIGDEVWVKDALTQSNESMRVENIGVEVDYTGEVVTIYCDYPRYRFEDEIQTIYAQLRKIGAVGVIKPDWTAQGIDQTQIDASAISAKSNFEKSAKNEESSQDKDIRTDEWSVEDESGNTPSSYEDYLADGTTKYQKATNSADFHGMQWNKTSSWMQLQGPSSDNSHTHTLRVAITQDDLGDILSLTLDRNPNMVLEVKIYEEHTDSPTWWADGDFFEAGLRGNVNASTEYTNPIGFWFHGVKQGEIVKLYAYYSLDGVTVVKKYIRDLNVGGKYGSGTALINPQKYRLEIVSNNTTTLPNGDIISNPQGTVIFNVYDLNTPDGSGEKNPTTVIGLFNGTDPASITVVPLWALISGTHGTSQRCQLYIYRYKTEWVRCLNP